MLHTELPIYKKGVELVSLAFHVQTQMRREFKRSLGEKITGHCTEMVNLMALANSWAIPNVYWIGTRIDAVSRINKAQAATECVAETRFV